MTSLRARRPWIGLGRMRRALQYSHSVAAHVEEAATDTAAGAVARPEDQRSATHPWTRQTERPHLQLSKSISRHVSRLRVSVGGRVRLAAKYATALISRFHDCIARSRAFMLDRGRTKVVSA